MGLFIINSKIVVNYIIFIYIIFIKAKANDCDIFGQFRDTLQKDIPLDNKDHPIVKKDIKKCCKIDGITCETIDNNSYITEIKINDYLFPNVTSTSNDPFKDLSQLEHLHTLNLANNTNLKQIPKSICELHNVKKLNLSNNQISEIPREIENLVNLVELDLSSNELDCYIPYAMKKLEHIETLKLNNNPNLKGYVYPKLNITNCSYENTNICNLLSSKCKSNGLICKIEDIDFINCRNGIPSSDMNEVENDIDNNEKLKVQRKYFIWISIAVIIFSIILYLKVKFNSNTNTPMIMAKTRI